MPKLGPELMSVVNLAFELYKTEVQASPLAPETKRTYIQDVSQFVQWLDDKYEPGKWVTT